MTPGRRGHTHVEIRETEVTPDELIRLNRLGRELRLTDQILSDDLDTVSIVDRGPAPAWTTLDGDHVSFALDRMPMPDSPLAVAVWLGTNAHELGHVLFSPRRRSPLMTQVIDAEQGLMRGVADLCNILEDQRQERLLLARFAPWRAYLTAALGHHLVATDENAWLLFAGRTWLPDAVRAEARDAFARRYGTASADEVTVIVGEYQRLLDPGDLEYDDAWALLVRLFDLFPSVPPMRQGRCQAVDGGEPDTSEPGGAAPDTADEAEAEAGDDGGAQEGAQEGDGDGETGDGDGNAQEDDSEGSGAGTGETSGPPSLNRPRAITEAAARQLDAADVAEDLAAVLGALEAGRGGDDVDGADARGRHEPVTDAARRLRHEVADGLLDLKDANEPAWVRRTDSGRLNVRRLADPYVDVDQIFDRYEAGALDASELELVLLLDASGSMDSRLDALAEATWAIRHAVDDLEGTATVLAWADGQHQVLASPGQRPDERMFIPHMGGGTRPETALAEAHRLLAGSTARNRLMVVLTDGQWYVPHAAERTIKAMNAAGIVTVCGLLGPTAGDNTHGCRYGEQLATLPDLARLFARVAAERIGVA